jgi:octaprenyl-diphosphate synthase
VHLTEGEIMQGRYRRNLAVTEQDYVEIVDRKTASLFSVGARIAAHLAQMPPAAVEEMNRCGREIGVAFQMIDDLLDIVGDPGRTGKRVGTDLLDGNPSLPIVWGLDLAPVRRAFTEPAPDLDAVSEALSALAGAGIPERLRDAAVQHAGIAAGIVRALEPSRYRDAILELIEDLVDRDL